MRAAIKYCNNSPRFDSGTAAASIILPVMAAMSLLSFCRKRVPNTPVSSRAVCAKSSPIPPSLIMAQKFIPPSASASLLWRPARIWKVYFCARIAPCFKQNIRARTPFPPPISNCFRTNPSVADIIVRGVGQTAAA